MYGHTHKAGQRLEWPDGGCYMKQTVVLVEMWELIADEIREAQREQRN